MARITSVRQRLDADVRMIRKMERLAAEVRRLRATLRESDARWERTLACVRIALYRATTSTPRDEREEAALGRVWMFLEGQKQTLLTVAEALDRYPSAACIMPFWYEDEEDFRCLAVVTIGKVRRAVTQFRGRDTGRAPVGGAQGWPQAWQTTDGDGDAAIRARAPSGLMLAAIGAALMIEEGGVCGDHAASVRLDRGDELDVDSIMDQRDLTCSADVQPHFRNGIGAIARTTLRQPQRRRPPPSRAYCRRFP